MISLKRLSDGKETDYRGSDSEQRPGFSFMHKGSQDFGALSFICRAHCQKRLAILILHMSHGRCCAGQWGLRVNDFMHLARGLFAFLASGGLQTHTRVFVIIARVGDIYRLACSMSESSVIYFYGTILAAFRSFCVFYAKDQILLNNVVYSSSKKYTYYMALCHYQRKTKIIGKLNRAIHFTQAGIKPETRC